MLPENLSSFYEYDRSKIFKILHDRKPTHILIQLPEGLKKLGYTIIDDIKNNYSQDISIEIDGSPIYGSCLMNVKDVEEYDIVFHFGHIPYPLWNPPVNVYFVDLVSKMTLKERTIDDLIKLLKRIQSKNIVIFTTPQHNRIVSYLMNTLRKKGFELLNNDKQSVIMGCWFQKLDTWVKRADSIIVLAGGLFHALGVGLRIHGSKHIIKVDPYENNVFLVDDLIKKYLQIRYGKIMKSMDSNTWLIISGSAGQFRPYLIKRLTDLIEKRKGKYYVARTSFVNVNILRNIDASFIDTIVITSCPRLAIEDLQSYEKPVLTVGEAFMVLKNELERYVFPW
jgi:2-(3-amino-3-carboxypropyl)histidine synthase